MFLDATHAMLYGNANIQNFFVKTKHNFPGEKFRFTIAKESAPSLSLDHRMANKVRSEGCRVEIDCHVGIVQQ